MDENQGKRYSYKPLTQESSRRRLDSDPSDKTVGSPPEFDESEVVVDDQDVISEKSSRIENTFDQNEPWDNYLRNDVSIEVSINSIDDPEKQRVDACTFSPNGKHLAAYFSEQGKILIWKVDKLMEGENVTTFWHSKTATTDLMKRPYWQKRKSFAPAFLLERNMTDVDFALSNDAKFVALSAIKLPQDEHDPEPFELFIPPLGVKDKIFTFVVNTLEEKPVLQNDLIKSKGSIRFTQDDESFVVCNVEYDYLNVSEYKGNFIYIFSTRSWKVKHKLIIDTFSASLRVIPHPWIQTKIVRNSFLQDYFVCVEQWDVASLWSLSTGQLVIRFKCAQKDSFLDADASPTLFSLSHNKKMLATWTSKGILSIFLCEGGLVFSSSVNNATIYDAGSIKESLLWLEGDEHVMTINAKNADNHHLLQIWDIYTCQPISRNDNLKSSFVFEPNGLDFYASYANPVPRIHKITTPLSQKKLLTQGLQIQNIGKHYYAERGFTRIYSYNKKTLYRAEPGAEYEAVLRNDHPIVDIHIEPWLNFTPIKSGFCLDKKKERVVYIGHYTVQIWIFKPGVEPELQYIWCRPVKDKGLKGLKSRIVYATIQLANLGRTQEGRYVLHVQCDVEENDKRSFSRFSIQNTTNYPLFDRIQEQRDRPRGLTAVDKDSEFQIDLILPDENERATFETIAFASEALGYLSFVERKYWIQISSGKIHDHFERLLEKCRSIITHAIYNDSHVFNQIVNFQSPLDILIKADCQYADMVIKEFLGTNKHIPQFYDPGKTKSALSRAIRLGKTDVVHSLLKYYCRRAEENPISWTLTIVPAFSALREIYPDFALGFVKSISYIPSKDEVIRSDRSELYAFSKVEELSREVVETPWQKFKTWWTKSERRIDRKIEGAAELVRAPRKTRPARECVVPLPDFATYRNIPKDIGKSVEKRRFPFFWKIVNYLSYRKRQSPFVINPSELLRSLFVVEVLSSRYELFGEPAMEAVINFKWRKFARTRVFIMLSLHLIYALAFMLGISTDNTIVKKSTMVIVLVGGTLFLLIEIRQMLGQFSEYWLSVYNWLDLAKSIVPMVVAAQFLSDEQPSEKIRGASMLFVYVDLLLHLRVFQVIGIPIFMILAIVRKVGWIIIIMGGMVVSFAHIFFILLDHDKNKNFQDFGSSLVSFYFILIGQYDSVSDERDNNRTITILLMLFSFFTAILLLNVLIAIMADVVKETETSGIRAWLKQKAEVIAEIEMYMMTSAQRRRKDYFPSLIYYYANPDNIKAYKKKLVNDDSEWENTKNDEGDVKESDIPWAKHNLDSSSSSSTRFLPSRIEAKFTEESSDNGT
ncbi:14516_t:CDS:10 [Acaulospora morrowiae]|uniref:14516_t:CDS:1 n=1 Tax=Acaulospora morrowiae TaxID=94023 RepID=A0A9N9AYQ2_9GLOM|nr:14516_t:CDS:10 [Acaulospora morrowiae]